MKTMKHVQALCALVFLLVTLASSTSNASILQDACKSFTAPPCELGYDYCLKFFQTDKGSAIADKNGLAVIATKIIETAAKSTAKHIDAMKASEKDDIRVGCLDTCVEVYSDVVNQTGEAAKGITSGKAEGLHDAVTALRVVDGAAGACEEAFDQMIEPSPLKVEDADFAKKAGLALCVVSALLPLS